MSNFKGFSDAIEEHRFRLRNDSWLPRHKNWEAKPGTVFSNGAVIWLEKIPIFLTSEIELLHPLAIYIPNRQWEDAADYALIFESNGILRLGYKYWKQGADLNPPTRPSEVRLSVLSFNTHRLKRCLPLLLTSSLGASKIFNRVTEASSFEKANTISAPLNVERCLNEYDNQEVINQSSTSSALLDALIEGYENEFTTPLASLRTELTKIKNLPNDAELACNRSKIDLKPFLHWFGRGEGSTPSWDDLITGLLLADRWYHSYSPSYTQNSSLSTQAHHFASNFLVSPNNNSYQITSPHIVLDDTLLAEIEQRTSPIAFWQLALARHGQANISLERFLQSVFTMHLSPAAVLAMAHRHGHTSGPALLAGIYLYLASIVE